MSTRTVKAVTTLTGTAGSASGTGVSSVPASGNIKAIKIERTGQPGTLDVTLATKNAPTKTFLTITNIAADTWYYPREDCQNLTGGVSAGNHDTIPIDDYFGVTCAQGDAGPVTVYVLVEVSGG